MNMNMGNTVYWHKNQVIIWLKSQAVQLSSRLTNPPPIELIHEIFAEINPVLQGLNLHLELFDTIPHLSALANSIDFVNNVGLLLFTHINPNIGPEMGPMQGKGGTAGTDTDDATLAVIKQLLNKETLLKGEISFDAIPHWLWASTPDPTHGCPTSPPIPVKDSGAPGQWKITLPQLSDSSLQDKTGEGVMVFVLDTLPSAEQIKRAANDAGNNNMLLQKMTTSKANGPQPDTMPPAIKLNYSFHVPDPAESAVTGKDIYGRLVGFPMADHGLAIAGIIRDLAPAANIECIRVLNDYGVGDLRALISALIYIQDQVQGDSPTNKPVVINLSLVVFPPDNDRPDELAEETSMQSRNLLQSTMQNLAERGAVFTASAGNDSDPRDTIMNSSEMRFGPRYPAAFAYDDPPITAMIPVAAVNRNGDAAMYSNHPGPNGIATYSGELPRPDPWLPSAMSHVATRVAEPIDALRCVYTAQVYPALSVNDPHSILPASPSAYPMYQASSTWAYWSGTSFATPIISALAARILQGREPKSIDVRQAVIDATTQQTMWTGVGDAKEDISSPMIMAVQEWQSANDTLIS